MAACKLSERSRQKIKLVIIIVITSCMFLTEIAVGYETNSLALVNDSFNMISDIMSLVIGFICLLLVTKDNKKNTYGWARVEIWAALVNSVFLLALCFSIFTSAIQRLINPETVDKADLVLIVGGAGLTVNLIGVLVFMNETCGGCKKAKSTQQQQQQQQDHQEQHDHQQKQQENLPQLGQLDKEEVDHSIALPREPGGGNVNHCFASNESNIPKIEIHLEVPTAKTRKLSVTEVDLPENWPKLSIDTSLSDAITAIERITVQDHTDVYPEVTIPVKRGSFNVPSICLDIVETEEEDNAFPKDSDEEEDNPEPTLVQIYAGPSLDEPEEIPRGKEKTKKAKKIKSGNEMNIQGIFLHLLGDAMGSISVIVSGLINKYCQGDWVSRVDPTISLIVVIFLVITTIPLLKQSSNILLQRIPRNVNIPKLVEELRKEVKDVANIHDLHVWQLVGTRIIASMHIRCSDLAQYIRASKQIKKFFHDNGIHSTTIQPEFIEHVDNLQRSDRECFLECGPEMKCHEDTCCCSIKKSKKKKEKKKKKKISTTSTSSGVSLVSTTSTDTAISVELDGGSTII